MIAGIGEAGGVSDTIFKVSCVPLLRVGAGVAVGVVVAGGCDTTVPLMVTVAGGEAGVPGTVAAAGAACVKLGLRITSGSCAKAEIFCAISGGWPSTLSRLATVLPTGPVIRTTTSLPILRKKLVTKGISPLSVRTIGLPVASRFIIKPWSTVPVGSVATAALECELVPCAICGGPCTGWAGGRLIWLELAMILLLH